MMGPVLPYEPEELEKLLGNPKIDRVEVFDGTPEKLKKRKAMTGKKYSVRKAYQKAPKIKSKKK